jgi:hypothetical protein
LVTRISGGVVAIVHSQQGRSYLVRSAIKREPTKRIATARYPRRAVKSGTAFVVKVDNHAVVSDGTIWYDGVIMLYW